MPGIAVVALFLPLLFPDGRLPSSRWKLVAYLAGASIVLAVILTMLAPATYEGAVDRRIKPTSPPVAAHSTSIDDLLMLAELHDRGVLTDDEFAAKKKQVLGI